MTDLRIFRYGYGMGESSRWHAGRLWFSDWGTQEIVAMDLEGHIEPVMHAPSFPFCFDWMPDGRLMVVAGNDGLLMSRQSNGSLVTQADLTDLAGTPWKDIVVDGRGNAYVGNIGFNFPADDFAPGVLAMVTPDGSARLVAEGIAYPHGMIVTPDNSTLIIAEAYASRLTAFDIAVDGSLSKRRVWADLDAGVPHGICQDAESAIWYADIPNQRCVRVKEGGEMLDTIDLERACFSCMLGGANNRTLYMLTAEWRGAADMAEAARTGQVLTAEVLAPRAGWP